MRVFGQTFVAMLFTLLTMSRAESALVINLRFADGSTTKNLWGMQDGDTIDFYVYATITGAAGNSAPEGLKAARYSLISQHIILNGSWIDYGLTGRQLQAPWSVIGSNGRLMDANQDGSIDLGTGSTTVAQDTAFPQVANTLYGPGSGFGQPVTSPSDGWEFVVQRVTFTVAFTNLHFNQQLRYNPVLYTEAVLGAAWAEDGQIRSVLSGGIYATGTSVTFYYVPEPSALAPVAIGMVLLKRRPSAHFINRKS